MKFKGDNWKTKRFNEIKRQKDISGHREAFIGDCADCIV